jgi:hypothetical protein
VERENSLNAMSKGNLPDRKRCARSAVFLSDTDSLEDLNALFVAFLNLHVDFDRVARLETRNVRPQLLIFNHF